MDASGDLAVGYSVSDGTSTYPGVRYAGRLVSDPPNELAPGRGDAHRRRRLADEQPRAAGATTPT